MTDIAPLQADIERSRAQLAVALEALGDRLSPKKNIARAKLKLSAKVEDVKDRISPVRVVKRALGGSRQSRPAIAPASKARDLPAGGQRPLELASGRTAE